MGKIELGNFTYSYNKCSKVITFTKLPIGISICILTTLLQKNFHPRNNAWKWKYLALLPVTIQKPCHLLKFSCNVLVMTCWYSTPTNHELWSVHALHKRNFARPLVKVDSRSSKQLLNELNDWSLAHMYIKCITILAYQSINVYFIDNVCIIYAMPVYGRKSLCWFMMFGCGRDGAV